MLKRLALVALASLFLSTLAFGATDSKLVSMLDPSARAVAGLNATAVKASPFGQYLLSRAANADLSRFIANTGFDPRADFQQALSGSIGGANKAERVLLVKGTFHPAQVFAFAAKKGATSSTYNGVKVAEFAAFQNKHGREIGPRWLAFFGNTRAGFGSPQFVKAAIERYVNNTPADAALASRIEAMSNKYDAWYFSTVPGPEIALSLPQSSSNQLVGLAANALQTVQSQSMGINFGPKGATIHGEAVTGSNQEALSLVDRLRYMASVAETQAMQKQKPTVATWLKKVTITAQGPDAVWNLQIPETQLVAWAQAHHHHANRK